jgi:hypothetical protein
MPFETEVLADWKILVAQWLSLAWPQAISGVTPGSWLDTELSLPEADSAQPFVWRARLRADAGWTTARYAACATSRGGEYTWRRSFLPPNQFVELRPDGLSLRQVLPSAPGRSKLRSYECSFCADPEVGRSLRYLAGRLGPWLGAEVAAQAESIQQNVVAFGYAPTHQSGSSGAEPAFREWLRRRIPALRRERGREPAPIFR